MANLVPHSPITPELAEQLVVAQDLKGLNSGQRVEYIQKLCSSMGLNPLVKPFEIMRFQGRDILYATKGASEQLRNLYSVSVEITDRQMLDGVYIVTARASTPDGRRDESTGAVSVGNAKGEALANAMMKAETKAKRRVTLSICGLPFLDETEIKDLKAQKKERAVSSLNQRLLGMEADTQAQESEVTPEVRTDVEMEALDLSKEKLTNDQKKEIWAIAQELGWDKDDLAAYCMDATGLQPSDLTQADFNDFLNELKGKAMESDEVPADE